MIGGPRGVGLLIVIIWLGFGLRLHGLGALPLRGDEAFSALYWAGLPLSQSLTEMAALDPHPPLAYALFRAWHLLLGQSDEFTLRFLPLLGNLLGMPVMHALGKRLSGSGAVGILASLLWALHPYEIWHSQDFRNYALWAGISALSFWLGLRLLDRPRRIDWLLYGVAALAAAMIFYTELFVLLALAAVAVRLRWRDWAFLRRFLSLQGTIVAVALLAFLALAGRTVSSGAYPGNLESFAPLDYLTRILPALLLGETLPLPGAELGMAFALILAGLVMILRRASARILTILLCWLFTPLMLLGLFSQSFAIFNPRYALAAAPALLLLLVLGCHHLAAIIGRSVKLARPLLTTGLLLPWLLLALLGIDGHFNDPAFRKSPTWDELGAFLNAHATADDLVIQLAVDVAFDYYYAGAARDLALPSNPLQSASEIADQLAGFTPGYRSVYVVAREQAGWRSAGLVESWMRGNMQAVMQSDASGLPIMQFMPWQVAEPGEAVAQFGEALALLAGERCPVFLPGGEWLLRLNWRALSHTAGSLKTFAHVYGASPADGGKLWTQDDHYPQAGRLDSRTWTPGDVFRDVIVLPADQLPPGSYEIHVGWYDPSDGARLQLADGGDSFRVCRLEV